MSLVTRCPRCKTLFRVLPDQLQARGGQVRCGRCMHAFDGFETLGVERSHGSAEPAPQSLEMLASVRSARNAFESRPTLDAVPERKPARRGFMISACALLVFLFFAQLSYIFRGELAARFPAMKTVLASACRAVGCAVSLPQRPDLVKIEASDVNVIDTGRPSLVQLTATLRSYADYDVAYPALDLVLTNATEHALARRIFLPEDYLGGTRDPQAGMPARGEITVALDLDTGNLNAAGFRLDLLPAH